MDVLLVDFNAMREDRTLPVSIRGRAIATGQDVVVWEPGEPDMAFAGRVLSVDAALACVQVSSDQVPVTLVPVSAAEVLAEVRVLNPSPLPEGACQACRSLTAALLVLLDPSRGVPSAQAVADVAALLDGSRHLGSPEFAAGYRRNAAPWCCFDLEMARQVAVLGRAGVPALMAWGPGHRTASPGTQPGHDATSCRSCREWLLDRAAARALCAHAGVDHRGLLDGDDRLLESLDER